MRKTIYRGIPALLLTALVTVGCTTARVVEPSQENLRDPLPAFVVEFDSNFVPGSFRAVLDPDTPGERDWTAQFTPAPQPGGTSAASIEEPFVGGTVQFSTRRSGHTLKLYSDSKVYGGGFSLERQRDRVEFFPVHVIFQPNFISFQRAGNGFPDVCLQPVPTRAVEVVISLGEGSRPLSVNGNPLAQQPLVVPIVPSPDGKRACAALNIRGTQQTPSTPPTYILGSCNGCQRGSANVQVLP